MYVPRQLQKKTLKSATLRYVLSFLVFFPSNYYYYSSRASKKYGKDSQKLAVWLWLLDSKIGNQREVMKSFDEAVSKALF